MPKNSPLQNVTAEILAPVWRNKSITTARIAAIFGCSDSAIGQKARSLGLAPRKTGPAMRAEKDLFSRMWGANVSVADMCKTFGYTQRNALYYHRKRFGLPPRDTNVTGSITAAEFYELELAEKMRAQAAQDSESTREAVSEVKRSIAAAEREAKKLPLPSPTEDAPCHF